MEHQNVSISGSQSEPFYELLQSNSSLASSSTNSTRAAAQHRPTVWEVPSSEFDNNDDDLLPSFDFHPTRGGSSSKTIDTASIKKVEDSVKKVEDYLFAPSVGLHSSAPSSAYAHQPKVYLSGELTQIHEPVKSKQEDRELYDSVTVAAVERTVKKYADNILRVLEGMSGRLSQLETTAQRLDYSFEGLKKVGGENHGDIDSRLRKVEEIVKEVHTRVQVLHDKQEITEVQSQFSKPQLPHNAYIASTSGASSIPDPDGLQQPKSEVPLHHHMPSSSPPPPVHPPLHHLPPPTAPSPPQSQTQHSQLHASPHPQQPLPPLATANVPSELAHHPIQQQPLSPSPQQHLAAPSLLQQPASHVIQPPPAYPQQSQLQHVAQGSYSQQLETPSYISVPPVHHPAPPASSTNNYGPEFPQYLPGNYVGPPSRLPPEQMLRPAQQHALVGHVYEPASGRTGSGPMPIPVSYIPHPQALPAAPTYEHKSGGYGSPTYKVAQPVPSAPSGGGSYPRLPTAQPLQHALPASDGGSGTSGSTPLSTNRVPIDEVIEKVGRMGFPRDQVRSVVRRLTENGQSVDLNVVLDKLMNGEDQPPKGWFGR